MRTFVAIDIPHAFVAQAEFVQRQLKQRARERGAKASWVPVSNMHATLAFLGDIGEPMATTLGDLLRQRLASHSPFDVELGPLGVFPNRRRPRTIWLGLIGRGDRLQALHEAVTDALAALDIAVERRRFHAHITLARVRSNSGDWLGPIDPPTAVHARIEDVVLYESTLSASGARYRALSRFALAGVANGPPSEFGSTD